MAAKKKKEAAATPAKASASNQESGKEKAAGSPAKPGLLGRFNGWVDTLLFSEVSIAPLVLFRIVFGLIMLWQVTRYMNSDSISYYYMEPEWYPKYFGWEWMPGPLPGYWMYIFYFVMGVIYFCYIIGLWYNVMSVLAFLGFVYWFNLDISQHLNHFYLVECISFVNIFLPLNRNVSLDAICRPDIRVAKVPSWTLYALVMHISIPYFWGGVAKIQPDWLRGEPMRMWMLDDWEQGHPFTQWWAAYFFSWGGMMYDLFVSPALIWKKTRPLALASTIFFHISNYAMFEIGIFPWLMLFSTPLYFEPEKSHWVFKLDWLFGGHRETKKVLKTPLKRRSLVKLFCFLEVFYHCFMPLRHHLYPGNVNWTEEGHRYSWHMMLRHKRAETEIKVTMPDGSVVDIEPEDYLTERQAFRTMKRPEAIFQFSHYLCDIFREKAGEDVQVFVNNKVSLNGRSWQHCIDPTVDMCKAKVSMRSSSWILPLEIPFWDKSSDYREEFILKKYPGSHYIGSRVLTKEDGKLLFGTVISYNDKEVTWRVRFDDFPEEEDYDSWDLARSQRRLDRYEHYGESLKPPGKGEVEDEDEVLEGGEVDVDETAIEDEVAESWNAKDDEL